MSSPEQSKLDLPVGTEVQVNPNYSSSSLLHGRTGTITEHLRVHYVVRIPGYPYTRLISGSEDLGWLLSPSEVKELKPEFLFEIS